MPGSTNPSDAWDGDVARVAQELAGRLRSRGIDVHDSDSPDDIERIVEAVEEFENAVEARGGDLMVDEPPTQGRAQPDDPSFLLLSRTADESAAMFLKRLRGATETLRRGAL